VPAAPVTEPVPAAPVTEPVPAAPVAEPVPAAPVASPVPAVPVLEPVVLLPVPAAPDPVPPAAPVRSGSEASHAAKSTETPTRQSSLLIIIGGALRGDEAGANKMRLQVSLTRGPN